MFEAAGKMMNIVGATAGEDVKSSMDRMIVKTCQGKQGKRVKEARDRVMEFVRTEAVPNLRVKKYFRPEKISADSDPISTHYYIVHLAVLYSHQDILDMFYTEMRRSKEYCLSVFNLRVDTELTQDKIDKFCDDIKILEGQGMHSNKTDSYKLYPDEVCGLTTMFLAVKYNPTALEEVHMDGYFITIALIITFFSL